MNNLLKQGLQQEGVLLKLKAKKICNQSSQLATVIFGWVIMLGATPLAAMQISNEGAYPLLGGLCVVGLFFLGAQFAKSGIIEFEEASREKTAGELLSDISKLPANTHPKSH